MEVQFKPALKQRDLYYDLEQLLVSCTSFKASLAYWTIDNEFFDSVLIGAMKRKESFVCFDISKPTNLAAINSIWRKGATQFYWYKYKVNEVADKRLLHSKVLLFDLPGDKAEIWVGSMNFTRRAIKGFNIESVTRITCLKTDKYYREVLDFLNFVKKDLCHPYDLSVPNNINYYTSLQYESVKNTVLSSLNLGREERVLSLVGDDITSIQSDDIIELFSLVSKGINSFKRGGKIYLQIADYSMGRDYLFEATVDGIGGHEEDKTGIDFIGKKRFSYIGNSNISFLEEAVNLTHAYQIGTEFWITVKIVRRVENFNVYFKPNEEEINLWKSDTDYTYSRILNLGEDIYYEVKVADRNYEKMSPRSVNIFKNVKESYESLKRFSREMIVRNNSSRVVSAPFNLKSLGHRSVNLDTRIIKE